MKKTETKLFCDICKKELKHTPLKKDSLKDICLYFSKGLYLETKFTLRLKTYRWKDSGDPPDAKLDEVCRKCATKIMVTFFNVKDKILNNYTNPAIDPNEVWRSDHEIGIKSEDIEKGLKEKGK